SSGRMPKASIISCAFSAVAVGSGTKPIRSFCSATIFLIGSLSRKSARILGLALSGIFLSLPNRQPGLCKNLLHDRASNIGEAEVAALVFEGQLRVVDAEAMEDRRVQVVDVDRVLRDVV